ncbi:hypothetical protein JCGZ_04241 [Jatropha curcas]|uniref:Uncharacterized protein n=1 Tax=Jatropha curcas TaxID=180498 RepID=A0A067KUE9_JATCU|nr:hypothetical protein JCGZ_04241 [Jatropha curcas]
MIFEQVEHLDHYSSSNTHDPGVSLDLDEVGFLVMYANMKQASVSGNMIASAMQSELKKPG